MTRSVIALYDSFADASATLRDLVDNGFQREDISLMGSDGSGEYGRHLGESHGMQGVDDLTSGAAEGAGVGAGIGAAIGGLGGLLIGLGALTIPGIGPVIAAGPLAAALTGLAGAGAGAVAGGVTGGLLGALVDLGVPEETAQYYAEGVRRGAHLVSVRTSDHLSDRAVEIMNSHNPMDINDRVVQWRESGWSGFDVEAEPYTENQLSSEPYHEVDEHDTVEHDVIEHDVIDSEIESEQQYQTTDYAYQDYETYEERFRSHFADSTYAGAYSYEQYQPAYRYGYDLAIDQRFQNREWLDVENEAYRRWEERNPGTWESFKDAVRTAWNEIRRADA